MPSIKYKKISEANIKRFKNLLEREKLSDKLKGKKKPKRTIKRISKGRK